MDIDSRIEQIRAKSDYLAKNSAKKKQHKYVSGKLELKGNAVTHFKFIEAIQEGDVVPHRSTLMSRVNDYFGLYTLKDQVNYYGVLGSICLIIMGVIMAT